MAINEVHVADVGLEFSILVKDQSGNADLSLATLVEFRFQKPDGTTLIVAGQKDGSRVYYRTASGDLDQTGTWRLQLRIVEPAEVKWSDVTKFKVKPNIPLEL